MADEKPTEDDKAARDAAREAAWAKAQEDIARHDREFEKKHGKKGSK